jgi:hypothetical protein
MIAGKATYGHILSKSFYKLGKVYEELGNTDKAIENY